MNLPLFHSPLLRKALFSFLFIIALADILSAQNSYRLSKSPFYKTFDKKAVVSEQTAIIYLPITVDNKTTTEFIYEGRNNVFDPIILVANQYIDSLQWFFTIPEDRLSTSAKGAPYLFVGSAESEIAPPAAEMLREEYDKFPPMVMHLDKPSKEWKAQLASQYEQNNAEYALVLWIGFNQYPKANKGLFKKKVVLGTGYEPEIRFFSNELEPVEVLQLTGILLNKKGEVVRAGAEAFLHEDSPFWVQVLEAETVISDKSMKQAVTVLRREDLPGKPLAWKVALHHLLQTLCNRS